MGYLKGKVIIIQVCTYAAIDNKGVRVTGNLDAANREEVIKNLLDKDLIVTKVACGVDTTKLDKTAMKKKSTYSPTG